MSEVDGNKLDDLICVLVVEDELFIGMELEAALTAGGFRVLGPAASVDVALELMAGERPSVAVLDFNLGREKVTPVALQLKALGVPFLLTSASGSVELARYSVLDGITNLGKPTDLERMIEVVRALAV